MQNLQALRSIWIAFISSPALYFLILGQEALLSSAPTINDQYLSYTVSAVALLFWMLAISFYRHKILGKVGFEKCVSQNQKEEFHCKWHIVCWLLLEAVAILGFVLSLLNKQMETYLLFFSASILGFVLTRPKEDIINPAAISALRKRESIN